VPFYVWSSAAGGTTTSSSEVFLGSSSDATLLLDSRLSAGGCWLSLSAAGLLDDPVGCATVVLLVTVDFFPRPPPPVDLSDSRRGRLLAASVAQPALVTAAGCTHNSIIHLCHLWRHLATTDENCWKQLINAWTGICDVLLPWRRWPAYTYWNCIPWRYTRCAKMNFLRFERYHLTDIHTDIQTDALEIIYHVASRVVNYY